MQGTLNLQPVAWPWHGSQRSQDLGAMFWWDQPAWRTNGTCSELG